MAVYAITFIIFLFINNENSKYIVFLRIESGRALTAEPKQDVRVARLRGFAAVHLEYQ